jgi:hypothetical protein
VAISFFFSAPAPPAPKRNLRKPPFDAKLRHFFATVSQNGAVFLPRVTG